jgi:hypothetical protein
MVKLIPCSSGRRWWDNDLIKRTMRMRLITWLSGRWWWDWLPDQASDEDEIDYLIKWVMRMRLITWSSEWWWGDLHDATPPWHSQVRSETVVVFYALYYRVHNLITKKYVTQIARSITLLNSTSRICIVIEHLKAFNILENYYYFKIINKCQRASDM